MVVSYKNLWYQLIDKKLKKADLKRMPVISPSTLANMTKDKNVCPEVLLKICDALQFMRHHRVLAWSRANL